MNEDKTLDESTLDDFVSRSTSHYREQVKSMDLDEIREQIERDMVEGGCDEDLVEIALDALIAKAQESQREKDWKLCSELQYRDVPECDDRHKYGCMRCEIAIRLESTEAIRGTE